MYTCICVYTCMYVCMCVSVCICQISPGNNRFVKVRLFGHCAALHYLLLTKSLSAPLRHMLPITAVLIVSGPALSSGPASKAHL